MQTLSLVIPAYNETQRLPALLDVLRGSARDAVAAAGFELVESLIVDDGSTDGTRALLEAAATPEGTIRPILDLKQNRGKGAAFRAGVMHARGDYVLMADVDLSTPLEELPKLTRALTGGVEIAIGSRSVEG
ncbi:MAG TPA: glycosyltransferase, partial [Solirubrobacterales bacterium]|nr:glycosyltransferase [Solirubrobacterales bacterium]